MKKIYALVIYLFLLSLHTADCYGLGKKLCHTSKQVWVVEDSSAKAMVTEEDGQLDIVSPDGLTLWYHRPLNGNYEISYWIKMVDEGGKYDRLSDMNCFWGAKDPEHKENFFARGPWRNGVFQHYNTLNLFYVGYGGNDNKTTRFREYHGERYGRDEANLKPVLKEYTDEGHLLQPNRWYEVVITAADGATTFSCNGEELFRLPVADGQADGYFAIRLWKNHVKVKNFTVRLAEQQFAYTNYRRYSREALKSADPEKRKALLTLRKEFSEQPYRATKEKDGQKALRYLDLLNEDGTFSDLNPVEVEFQRQNAYNKGFKNTTDDKVGIFIADALNRIFAIGDAGRQGFIKREQMMADKVMRAIIHYGDIEISRPNDKPRFHASCFAIPTAASVIYFAYLDAMDRVEKDPSPSLLKDACDMLKALGMQAYTQPLRNDPTDRNVVSLERFRNHVWWVGGNALAYRSLLPVAAMYRSVKMIDLLAEVCQKGISMTSQTTYDSAFWIEGFTADGAGWGHGKQCLIWGYPIDGTNAALNMLTMLKNTPWAQRLSRENVAALMNFFRGGNWYYYKGFRLPGLDRKSYVYEPEEKHIPYLKLLDKLLDYWITSFSEAELAELKQLKQEAMVNRIKMDGYEPGVYNGTRWFFNNDDLMKKTDDYHVSVNMASLRSDGLESAEFADNYNFYPTDGMTLFQRQGNEYFSIMGGWDVTASPGVTAREGMGKLIPVTNWRGYCSRHDWAAGATHGGQNAVAGYLFDKIHGALKEGVNDRGDIAVKNNILYGFKATKGYFIVGDYFVALGAGVTNDSTQIEGNIRTTIDQTVKTAPVYLKRKGKSLRELAMSTSAEMPVDSRTWVVQEGGFAYTVLPEYTSNFYVACESRTTDWVRMNPSNAKKKDMPAQVPVLRLWIDHGRNVSNDTYGYVVYLGKDEPVGKLPFEVLRNDTLVQAVRSADKRVIEAMFYSGKAELKAKKLSVKVSSPCALLMEERPDGWAVTVADALMDASLKEIVVTVNGHAVRVGLPQGMWCGKPATTVWYP